MATSAATTYDPTQDEGGSENSDVELDVELQQELPNREDFRGAVAAVGQRGTVCRTHPLQVGSWVSSGQHGLSRTMTSLCWSYKWRLSPTSGKTT